MAELTGAQRKYLRGMAHYLKPIVQLGKNGLTDGVIASIDKALEDHELIKVRIAGAGDAKRAQADEIAQRTRSAWVGMVGFVVILYRQQPDPEKQTIELPS
ncbi:MAG TPA: ribosome assembly RNA-binding protein YhbY [Thermoanaerobaculia bacterium]|jgi:RNA-binding protein